LAVRSGSGSTAAAGALYSAEAIGSVAGGIAVTALVIARVAPITILTLLPRAS
jgi:hypothetical protein